MYTTIIQSADLLPKRVCNLHYLTISISPRHTSGPMSRMSCEDESRNYAEFALRFSHLIQLPFVTEATLMVVCTSMYACRLCFMNPFSAAYAFHFWSAKEFSPWSICPFTLTSLCKFAYGYIYCIHVTFPIKRMERQLKAPCKSDLIKPLSSK